MGEVPYGDPVPELWHPAISYEGVEACQTFSCPGARCSRGGIGCPLTHHLDQPKHTAEAAERVRRLSEGAR